MSGLDDLIERVSKATGYDQSLDDDIGKLTGGDPNWTGPARSDGSLLSRYAHVTYSLDAAVDLAGRLFPGAGLRFHTEPGKHAWAAINAPGRVSDAHGATLPLALLAATLKALPAKDTEG